MVTRWPERVQPVVPKRAVLGAAIVPEGDAVQVPAEAALEERVFHVRVEIGEDRELAPVSRTSLRGYGGRCHFLRRAIFDAGVKASSIVPAFQIAEHVGPGLGAGQIIALIDESALSTWRRSSPSARYPSSHPCGTWRRACRVAADVGDRHGQRIGRIQMVVATAGGKGREEGTEAPVRSVPARRPAVTRTPRGGAARTSAAVLGGDCSWAVERGCGDGRRGLRPGRRTPVPGRWQHATPGADSASQIFCPWRQP
jgi:hypothetical protein